MTSILIVIGLNLAFLAWVIRLVARDPGNLFKRRRRRDDADDQGD